MFQINTEPTNLTCDLQCIVQLPKSRDLREAASVSNQYLKQPEKCCNKNIALCGIKQQRLKKAIAVREESDHNP